MVIPFCQHSNDLLLELGLLPGHNASMVNSLSLFCWEPVILATWKAEIERIQV
jgi:hypothetical protein